MFLLFINLSDYTGVKYIRLHMLLMYQGNNLAIRKQIFEAFERGEKKIEEMGFYPSTWYQFFDFKRDPFKMSPLDPLERRKDLDLFVNRTAELEEIAEFIGMTKKASHSFNLAIIGAEGIGKRSIVRVVNAFALEKGYKGMIYNVDKDEVIYPEDYERPPVMGPPEERWNYIVFEDPKPVERVKSYVRKFLGNPTLIISFWTPEQLVDLEFDRELYIPPLKSDEIQDMILLRIKNAGGKKERISEDALELIAKNSLGVPKLGLKLARYSFELAFRKRKEVVDLDDVKEASTRFGYETRREIVLTTKEKEIVRFLLKKRYLSPPELADEASIDRVIAWKYLERLKEKGLLEKEYRGKTSYFRLREALAVKLQLELYPKRA